MPAPYAIIMNSISLFSGIGGFDFGFEQAGIKTSFFCEKNIFCKGVLKYHWPEIRLHEDITTLNKSIINCDADLIHGGFPCQDVSSGGSRLGLNGDKSILFWEFHRILVECKPRWFVIENVSGLLSSNAGRDMGTVTAALVDAGYGIAYRVLDSTWFGLPHRRKRIFIVGYLGDWRPAAKVLDIGQGRFGNTEASGRKKNENPFRVEEDLRRVGEKPIAINLNQDPVTSYVSPSIGYNFRIGVFSHFGLRRLTPVECERLQGFPDNWTLYGNDGRVVSDKSRYRMLGNAVSTPIAKWIGSRIADMVT